MGLESDPVVSYTVKEVLVRLESKFDNLTENILGQVNGLTERVTALEHDLTGRKSIKSSWVTIITLLAAVAAGAGTLIVALSHG